MDYNILLYIVALAEMLYLGCVLFIKPYSTKIDKRESDKIESDTMLRMSEHYKKFK